MMMMMGQCPAGWPLPLLLLLMMMMAADIATIPADCCRLLLPCVQELSMIESVVRLEGTKDGVGSSDRISNPNSRSSLATGINALSEVNTSTRR